MNQYFAFAQKMSVAYQEQFKVLCKKFHLSQTAFDILLFLANNPQYKTARDIVEIRRLKANLVSMNVNRLVDEGYLERKEVPEDRRKTELLCTKKAQPIIQKGQELQNQFFTLLFEKVKPEQKQVFFEVVQQMVNNLNEIIIEGKKEIC